MRHLNIFILATLLLAISLVGFSQSTTNVKISEQQDIAVFASYYTYDIPANIVNRLDDGIMNLFLTMRRFKVNGYQFRFSEGNLETFISRVKQLKEGKITTSEKFVDPKWGTITLTPDMLEKLLNSFTIVIPNIKTFGVESKWDAGDTYYIVTMGVSLKFFDPDTGEIFAVIDARTTYSGKSSELIEMITGIKGRNLTKEETIEKAIDSLLEEIKYKIRGIEKFKLYTTINDKVGGKYYVELGKNYDIYPGLELELIKTRTVKIGGKDRSVKEIGGLVRVVNAEEDFSEVIPIFGEPNIGDQLTDALRRGYIFKLFFGLQNIIYEDPRDTFLLSYFQSKWNNLQDGIAPMIGISGINDDLSAFFEPQADVYLVISSPITLGVGLRGNYAFYLRNIKVKPYVGLDLIGAFTYLGSIWWWWYYYDFYLTTFSIAFNGGLSLEILFSKSFGLSFDAGYRYSIPIYDYIRVYDSWGNSYESSFFSSSLIPLFALRGINGKVEIFLRF
ncbi:MAG: hypothetical protein ACP5PT_03515 [Brevinematia bacterium]